MIRTPMQDWRQAHNYFPLSIWDALLGADVSQELKLKHFLQHLILMGLVCPSEPTMQFLCALYLVVTEGIEAADAMNSIIRHQSFKMVKAAHKRFLQARVESVPEICVTLPDDPTVFQASFPQLWQRAFANPNSPGLPVPSKVPLLDITRIQLGIPMRNTNQQSAPMRLQLAPAEQTLQQPLQQFVPQMVAFAQQMQQQMQQLQQLTVGALQQHGLLPPAQGGVALALPPTITRLESRLCLTDNASTGSVGAVPVNAVPGNASSGSADIVVVPGNASSGSADIVVDKQDQDGPRKTDEDPVDNVTKQLLDAYDKHESRKRPAASTTSVGSKKSTSVAKKAVAPAVKKKAITTLSKGAPSFSHERSRNQYLCRTGLSGPGQSHSIKYDPEKSGSEAKALRQAETWLRSQKKPS